MNNKILLVSFMAMMLVMPSVALAQTESITQCLNNETLQVYQQDERCIDGNCRDFSTNKTTFCTYGCSDDFGAVCNPDPFTVNVMFAVILFIIMLIIAFFLKRGNIR